MPRRAPRPSRAVAATRPCVALGLRFTGRDAALACHRARSGGYVPIDCECGGWRLKRVEFTEDQRQAMAARAEAERRARVAAHLATVPERSR